MSSSSKDQSSPYDKLTSHEKFVIEGNNKADLRALIAVYLPGQKTPPKSASLPTLARFLMTCGKPFDELVLALQREAGKRKAAKKRKCHQRDEADRAQNVLVDLLAPVPKVKREFVEVNDDEMDDKHDAKESKQSLLVEESKLFDQLQALHQKLQKLV